MFTFNENIKKKTFLVYYDMAINLLYLYTLHVANIWQNTLKFKYLLFTTVNNEESLKATFPFLPLRLNFDHRLFVPNFVIIRRVVSPTLCPPEIDSTRT